VCQEYNSGWPAQSVPMRTRPGLISSSCFSIRKEESCHFGVEDGHAETTGRKMRDGQ